MDKLTNVNHTYRVTFLTISTALAGTIQGPHKGLLFTFL
jgi:hypothetical protein